MQELMKSMRAGAAMSSGLFDNDGQPAWAPRCSTRRWRRQMTGRPGGLSEAIAKQLERQMGLNPGPIPKPDSKPLVLQTPEQAARAARAPRIPEKAAASFVQQHEQAAAAAERTSGIPASFMVAQAAHESGWGRHEITHADGTSTPQPVRHQGRRQLEGRRGRGDDHRIRQRRAARWCSASAPTRAPPNRSPTTPRLMKSQPALPGGGGGRQRRARIRRRPAARRLCHRPGLRRQAEPRHQHHAASARQRDLITRGTT